MALFGLLETINERSSTLDASLYIRNTIIGVVFCFTYIPQLVPFDSFSNTANVSSDFTKQRPPMNPIDAIIFSYTFENRADIARDWIRTTWKTSEPPSPPVRVGFRILLISFRDRRQ